MDTTPILTGFPTEILGWHPSSNFNCISRSDVTCARSKASECNDVTIDGLFLLSFCTEGIWKKGFDQTSARIWDWNILGALMIVSGVGSLAQSFYGSISIYTSRLYLD